MLNSEKKSCPNRQIILKKSIPSALMSVPYPEGTPLEWIRHNGRVWVMHPNLKWILAPVEKENIQSLTIREESTEEVLFNLHMAKNYYQFEINNI